MLDFDNISTDDRARIVAESSFPGAVIAEVARAHGISPGTLYGWRNSARKSVVMRSGSADSGSFTGDESAASFVELEVTASQKARSEPPPSSNISKVSVEFGTCNLSLEGKISVARLSQILTILEASC